jgi:transposase InsO family protein
MSSKHRVVVLKIVAGQLTVSAAAAEYGLSRQYLHKLLARYRQDGLDGLEPRSRAPRSSPQAVTDRVRDRIVQLRGALTAAGTDAGPVTIAWHLTQEGLRAPSTSTIRRILHTAGLIVPEPRKRPKSSYIRFEAAQPNETWQSDFTHWRLADGADVEILNWLDDYSRMLLSCTAHRPVTGRHVVDTFLATIDAYGPPASTLTDNGRVYTARHAGARNEFEYVLAALNIRQKNGAPNHPQTQGKIERFHQTLKRWLTARPRARTIPELQAQLNAFRHHYNTARPHRARDGLTPTTAYAASPKAAPAGTRPDAGHYRIRYDHVDTNGKISFRRAARMHHLGIGADHRGKRCILIADEHTVTVVHLDTAEILATNTINPARTYWRNNEKEPGRWPSSFS